MDDAEVASLAALIHQEQCADLPRCGRWGNPSSDHQQYYLGRARTIIERLEPEIGIANVTLAVSVILDELS